MLSTITDGEGGSGGAGAFTTALTLGAITVGDLPAPMRMTRPAYNAAAIDHGELVPVPLQLLAGRESSRLHRFALSRSEVLLVAAVQDDLMVDAGAAVVAEIADVTRHGTSMRFPLAIAWHALGRAVCDHASRCLLR